MARITITIEMGHIPRMVDRDTLKDSLEYCVSGVLSQTATSNTSYTFSRKLSDEDHAIHVNMEE